MTETVIYCAADDKCPFEIWFNGLDAQTAAKITSAISRLEQGNVSQVKSVGDGVCEYRLDWGPGFRLYFGREGDRLIILLNGGTKKRQQRDIETARGLWADYKRRR